jgi:hypothetical protein
MLDQQALADRLYADALAAHLRMPRAFLGSQIVSEPQDVEDYARERATVYREELSVSEAEAEGALTIALKRWRDVAPTSITRRSDTTINEPVRTVTLLSRAAKKLLQPDGGEMILRVDHHEPGREILRWRFLSLALPPSILVAAAMRGSFNPPEAVRLLHSSIAPDGPVAQQHVHHAAMMSFEELWGSFRLRALFRPGTVYDGLRDKRALCPGLHRGICLRGRSRAAQELAKKNKRSSEKHMDQWGDLIRNAFIGRRVLDRHEGHPVSLDGCMDPICSEGKRVLRAFLNGRAKPDGAARLPYPWLQEAMRLGRRYRVATAIFGRSQDPRAKVIGWQAEDERRLLVRAFAHVRPDEIKPHDPLYEKLFLQYLRVKTAVFGLLVHPPGEHGLNKFLDHFNQIKVYAPEAELLAPRIPREPGLDVRATEYRVATDAWLKILKRHDAEIEDPHRPDAKRRESAWLIHFKRKPREDTLPFYLGAVHELENEATLIVNALEQKPIRLKTLRGIDICGVEEAQPLWVSAETLRRVRTRSSEIAGRRPKLGLQPLRLTLHAGEDFEWLTSGMRAAAEPFHWQLIQRGDRIGHGIAITLDPVGWWTRKKGRVIEVKRFDRLLDLVFLAEYTTNITPVQEIWLRDQIEECTTELFGTSEGAVESAKFLWLQLGGRMARRLMKTSERPDTPIHERWFHQYLWDRSVQKRAGAVIRLPVGEDVTERDLLVKARARVIHELARWQVCIESNPSSNLVVGSLDAVAAQDFLARRPTREAPYGQETLTWTISTDDPITFSTTLADEYAYAWAGMVLRKDKPYDPSYARALLDEAAATSMRTRFTIPREDQVRTDKDTGKRRGNARST